MRAEALATLALTRRDDLEVVPLPPAGQRLGFDLLVRMRGDGGRGDRELAVEVKGVRAAARPGLGSGRIRVDAASVDRGEMPLVLFVFDVDEESGRYAWLREPIVDRNGKASLSSNRDLTSANGVARSVPIRWANLASLDESALAEIVALVSKWYGARENGLTDRC